MTNTFDEHGEIHKSCASDTNGFTAGVVGKNYQPEKGQKNGFSATSSPSSNTSRKGLFSRISGAIVWALEACFFRVGYFVGEYPVLCIVVPVIMCGLCGLGMKTFQPSADPEKLWVPSAARVVGEKDWVDTIFPRETRYVSLMFSQRDNILSPSSINAMMDIYKHSLSIRLSGSTFLDFCVRLGPYCYVSSLLELWLYDEAVIRRLNASEILQKINNTKTTPISGVEVTTLLGGKITYGPDGAITSAEATEINWITEKENSNAERFEKEMIDFALKEQRWIGHIYAYATRSFDDEGYGAINSDAQLLTSGFSIVFVFILLSLGKFNLLEQKVYLSLTGMLCVGLSVLVSYGVATAFSVVYSPIQFMLPFLLLGIGVDDMFIVVENWKNLSPEEEQLSIPNKIAITLCRAGVSITVTSITDIVAFGIGATTVIPALSSFCIYATIGILALFLLVSTVFTGVLALDERRRRERRDGCIVCYVHPESYTPSSCSQGRSILQTFFKNYYGPFLMNKAVKVAVIVLAVVVAALGLWRFIKMPKDFDLINYIPSHSYAYRYGRAKEKYFSNEGVDVTVYCGNFDYLKYRTNMDQMYTKLSQSDYIQSGTIVAWFVSFNQVVGGSYSNEAEYNHAVFQFTKSPVGSRFASFIKFNSTEEPVSILATKFTLTHVLQSNSDADLDGMDNIRGIIDGCGFPSFPGEDMPETMCFAFAREYLTYETIKVLLVELYRNLGLAAAAVLLVTIVLVANVRTSFLVFICVVFTVIDVGGVLEVMGSTIDTASSILLTLSMGLAVDYSAHVGHTFMTVQGELNERMVTTLQKMGPAVFNGGLSTFLAFVLLARSESYGFQLFFRVFMSVVLFGMFHGLAFLPVLLSMVGPQPYAVERQTSDEPGDMPVLEGGQGDESKSAPPYSKRYAEMGHLGYDGPQNQLYHQPDDTYTKSVNVTSQPGVSSIIPSPSVSPTAAVVPAAESDKEGTWDHHPTICHQSMIEVKFAEGQGRPSSKVQTMAKEVGKENQNLAANTHL